MWLNVFSVEAFSGIHIFNYFATGDINAVIPAATVYPTKIYRHSLMVAKLEAAQYIRFSIYDLDMNKVRYIIFQPLATDDFKSWFTWDRVKYNWGWNFDTKNPGVTFLIQTGGAPQGAKIRFFMIVDYYQSNCNDFGWFMALTRSNPEVTPWCGSFENWWTNSQLISAGKTNQNQPPAFIYADTIAAENFKQHKHAGKITIDVL